MELQPVPVLFVDDHLVVVAKPAGVSVVFDRHRPREGTLWETVWERVGPVLVVHRLDRETTGALLLARHRAAQRALCEAFFHHRVGKTYHGVVCGVPPWRELTAEHPLREDGDRAHRTVVDWAKGKPARTHLRLLRLLGPDLALVEAVPVTGRRHQVRAHLAAVGFPLLGDGLYGGGPAPRVFLHAFRLVFVHPFTGTRMEVEAPYPDDFARVAGRRP